MLFLRIEREEKPVSAPLRSGGAPISNPHRALMRKVLVTYGGMGSTEVQETGSMTSKVT